MSGSFQVKAKRKDESRYKETVKKVSFKSRTVKKEVAERALDKRLYGLITTG